LQVALHHFGLYHAHVRLDNSHTKLDTHPHSLFMLHLQPCCASSVGMSVYVTILKKICRPHKHELCGGNRPRLHIRLNVTW